MPELKDIKLPKPLKYDGLKRDTKAHVIAGAAQVCIMDKMAKSVGKYADPEILEDKDKEITFKFNTEEIAIIMYSLGCTVAEYSASTVINEYLKKSEEGKKKKGE